MKGERIANFRDVGEWVNTIAARRVMLPLTLYRGGQLEHPDDGAGARTVINLRKGRDPQIPGAVLAHVPRTDDTETFHTWTNPVKRWLNDVIAALAAAEAPIFVHCAYGKDRTGVAIGALLTVLDVPRAVILEEFALSDGAEARETLARSLDALADAPEYFARAAGRPGYAALKTNLTARFAAQ